MSEVVCEHSIGVSHAEVPGLYWVMQVPLGVSGPHQFPTEVLNSLPDPLLQRNLRRKKK